MDIFKFFWDRVINSPSEIMMIDRKREICYGEASRIVDYYAERIIERTGGEKKRILLKLDHSYRIIICILAVLKTGNSYVPINKDSDDDRVRKIGEYCASDIIITDSKQFCDMKEIVFEEEKIEYVDYFDYVRYDTMDEVYVLFTSGSTGEPKGCSVLYHNLCYIMKNMIKIGDWNNNSRVCFSTPYTFDVSTTEIYGFVYGASIYVYETAKTDLFKNFPYIISEKAITHLALSPSGLKNMYNAYTDDQLDLMGATLKCVMVAGEAFKKEIYTRWNDSNWNYRLLNLYGPTEATVYATGYELHKGDVYDKSIPIGKCLAGCVFYIDKPDESGIGELVLGGEGIANGYINNPSEQNKRFFLKDNIYYYRTGDLVSLEEEILMYHGRNDDQVQINGIRVELGEIETRINELDEIKENVVIYYNGMLIATIVMNDGVEFSPAAIRDKLGKKVPRYMIPNSFRTVDAFQLNVNNKIDRKKVLENYLSERNKKIESENSDSSDRVLKLMRECLEENGLSLSMDDDFFENGGDSLSALLLITKLEQLFRISLDADIIYTYRSCRRIVRYIKELESKDTSLDIIGKSIAYDKIVDLTKQIKSYLYDDSSTIKHSYAAMYIHKYYYDRKFNSSISFKYDLGDVYKLDEVEDALKTLLSENGILISKIRSENDWVYFDEYELNEKDISVVELPYEDSAFTDFVVKNYSEELYTARYNNGYLSFFIIVKSGNNISVIGILDHSIADGASVSIIKLKISSILNKKERNETISYREYCEYIRKDQCNIEAVLDNWYMKLLRDGEVKNKKQLLESKETKSCHYVIENVMDDSNTSIIKNVGYWVGDKLSDWIGNACVALRFIVNLRDYCSISLKNTLGDLHASLSFFYCKGDTYNSFADRVDDVIDLLGNFCSRHSLYIEDNKYSDKSRVGELTDLIDNAEFISVSYQGAVTDEQLARYEKEMSEAHKSLSSANARLFVTVFYNKRNIHVFLNKHIF